MTKGRRSRKEWRRLIAEWRASGESQAAFAARHRIPRSTFSWWSWELKREASDSLDRAIFVPIEVRDVSARSEDADHPIAVLERGPCRLRIERHADPRWVATLLAELGC